MNPVYAGEARYNVVTTSNHRAGAFGQAEVWTGWSGLGEASQGRLGAGGNL